MKERKLCVGYLKYTRTERGNSTEWLVSLIIIFFPPPLSFVTTFLDGFTLVDCPLFCFPQSIFFSLLLFLYCFMSCVFVCATLPPSSVTYIAHFHSFNKVIYMPLLVLRKQRAHCDLRSRLFARKLSDGPQDHSTGRSVVNVPSHNISDGRQLACTRVKWI